MEILAFTNTNNLSLPKRTLVDPKKKPLTISVLQASQNPIKQLEMLYNERVVGEGLWEGSIPLSNKREKIGLNNWKCYIMREDCFAQS